MKDHLVASVHHAAKADAYGKLGYRQQQREHAARALQLQFGGDDDDSDDDEDDDEDDEEDEDIRKLMLRFRKQEGSLIPRSMRRAPVPLLVSRSALRQEPRGFLADGTDRKRIVPSERRVSTPSGKVGTEIFPGRVPARMPPVWRDLLNRQRREFANARGEARWSREWPKIE
jgi:hypothetical protein